MISLCFCKPIGGPQMSAIPVTTESTVDSMAVEVIVVHPSECEVRAPIH